MEKSLTQTKSKTNFFSGIFQNIASLYRGRNLVWQVIFCLLTYILVVSGFDWWYYEHTRNVTLQSIFFTAAIAGFLIPVLVPIGMFIYAAITKNIRIRNAAYGISQAGILGLAISSFYKVVTGRPGPYHLISGPNISTVFRFGILRGGAFQGWPSSHTATAFAMSFALINLFPKNKAVQYGALIYTFYIGIGVSATIHWFSDFVAGAILGAIIGIAVGKSFLKRV